MSVLGQRSKLLFCEGRPESLDVSRLAGSSRTTIIPVGGKQRLGAFIQGRLSSLKERPSYIALFLSLGNHTACHCEPS